jgi:hypothetical protein
LSLFFYNAFLQIKNALLSQPKFAENWNEMFGVFFVVMLWKLKIISSKNHLQELSLKGNVENAAMGWQDLLSNSFVRKVNVDPFTDFTIHLGDVKDMHGFVGMIGSFTGPDMLPHARPFILQFFLSKLRILHFNQKAFLAKWVPDTVLFLQKKILTNLSFQ